VTSKIQSDADIEGSGTLGFAGSGAVDRRASPIQLSSRDAGSDFATSVKSTAGGSLVGRRRAARYARTLSLFYNAPARRKFLRLAETERQRSVEICRASPSAIRSGSAS
jgi:DNA mismatch repair ATPase MutL